MLVGRTLRAVSRNLALGGHAANGLSDGCTVAIVTLGTMDIDDLPGQSPERERKRAAVTTFRDLYNAGQLVYEYCVHYGRRPEAGWNYAGRDSQSTDKSFPATIAIALEADNIVGRSHSVGIFFWATDSEMDNKFNGRPWPDNPAEILQASNTTNLSVEIL